jgi:hypothetical protein
MSDQHSSPLEPNETQRAHPGLDGNKPNTPLDPSYEQSRGLRVGDAAIVPLDPSGERIYRLGSDGNKHNVPLDPTPEQLHRLGLGASPKSYQAPKE